MNKIIRFNYKIPTSMLKGRQKIGRKEYFAFKTTSLEINFWRIHMRFDFRTAK